MKKFKFSLQSLYDYKLTVEKLQKAELRKAQEALRVLLEEEQRLQDAYADTERSLEKALREGINVGAALTEHDAYFGFLRDAIKEVREQIARAAEYKNKCEAQLITTMKEIKTYVKLRAEQYQDYLKEVRTEEEKNIGDLVSFITITEETNQ